MQYFTVITGVASLISLGIQLLDLFPQFRRQRQAFFLVIAGVFIGSLIRGINISAVQVSFQPTGFSLLIGFIAIAVTGVIITAASSTDRAKRMELYTTAGVGVALLGFILFFGSLIEDTRRQSVAGGDRDRLTLNELSTLADRAEAQNDLERAISYLETIAARLDPHDQNGFKIRDRIKELRGKSIGYAK
jgi:hypothetical protein